MASTPQSSSAASEEALAEFPTEAEIASAHTAIRRVVSALEEVLYGQSELIEKVLVGLLARGHLLLEGLPGLGKTELVKALGAAFALETKRIQFTPDLLPGDITGNPLLEEREGRREFVFHPGPLFGSLVLADEINRASPKTQSALLEAMQEAKVTVLGKTHDLTQPFFVLATQNPIELEGTYPLPEAQLDRFLFKLEIGRSDVATLEKIIAHRDLGISPGIDPVSSAQELLTWIELARRLYLPPAVRSYIARLVAATHEAHFSQSEAIAFGASPRAAIALAAASRARALLQGRANASFEDVQALALPVLGHRIVLDYSARVEGITTSQCIADLLAEVPPQEDILPATLQK